jgi:hypothetical protein
MGGRQNGNAYALIQLGLFRFPLPLPLLLLFAQLDPFKLSKVKLPFLSLNVFQAERIASDTNTLGSHNM